MCQFVILSGGFGFHEMGYHEAAQAAKELGAVFESTHCVANSYRSKNDYVAISFFNREAREVLHWIKDLQCGQVFDPPREVADKFLGDITA